MTQEQRNGVKCHIDTLLRPVFSDVWERTEMVGYLIDDVVSDIDACADWTSLASDEINCGDIEIALSRVLLDAVRFNYCVV
jgi:hypothetical protein